MYHTLRDDVSALSVDHLQVYNLAITCIEIQIIILCKYWQIILPERLSSHSIEIAILYSDNKYVITFTVIIVQHVSVPSFTGYMHHLTQVVS